MTNPSATPADLLIVGSGIMGAGVAKLVRDARPTASIVMIDGGPVIGGVPGQHLHDIPDPEIWEQYNVRVSSGIQGLYTGVPATPEVLSTVASAQPGMYHLSSLRDDTAQMPASAVAWNVGGMGAHWTAATPWPFGSEVFDFGDRQQWDRDLDTARELLHVHPEPYAQIPPGKAVTAVFVDHFAPVSAAGRGVQPMPMAVEPRDGHVERIGPNRIFPPMSAGGDPHFTLLPNTLAVEVLHQDGHATGARVVDQLTGEQYELAARQVIVCADTLRTPQLLFASGIRPPALGRSLNEHAFLTSRVIVDLPRFGLAPADLEPMGEGEFFSQSRWLPQSGPEQPFHGLMMDSVFVDDDGAPIAYSVGFAVYVPNELNPDNRVEFSDSEKDAAGLPKMTIVFRYSDADQALADRGRALQAEVLSKLGVFDPSTESAQLPAGSSLHYTGTVRMGETDDGTSVCSPQGRIWGFDNLSVAGNGAVPTALVCNSTLTGMTTVVRAAREIVDSIQQ